MNLADQSVELLWKGPGSTDASFLRTGRRFLSRRVPLPSERAGQGDEGMIPNDYDGELYVFDVATKAAEP